MADTNKLDRKTRRLIRRGRHRFIKNLFIWLLGVIFIPTVLVATMMFIPLSMFVGSDGKVVSQDIAKDSLFNATLKIAGGLNNYGVSDFPVIETTLNDLMKTKIIDNTTVGDLVEIDNEKLNAIKFNGDAIDSVLKSVSVTATLKKVGAVEMLGDFGDLTVFTEWENADKTAGEAKDEADKSEKWYKMYYYQDNGKYVRAFTDEGNYVTGVNAETPLMYPALQDVVVTDLVDIIGESIGRVKISNLLEIFGAANDTLISILGENTRVTDLSEFDINSVKLSVVIADDGGDLYKVLADATGVPAADITIGDLSSLEVDNIKLSTVIENNDDTKIIYDILSAATNTPADELSIGSLTNDLEINNVKLTAVLENNDANEAIYDILSAATNKPADEITIGDLSGDNFDIRKVKLVTVIAEEDAVDLYDILFDMLEGKESATSGTIISGADDITIGDLSDNGFDLNSIKLKSIIAENEDSEQLYKVLRSALNKAEDYDVTIGDLRENEFDINNIALETVLKKKIEGEEGYNENKKLWDVLDEAIEHTGETITVGDLVNGFDLDRVPLNLVVPEITDEEDPEYENNKKFWKILKQATGVPNDVDITIGNLSNGFYINNVLLEDVIKKDTESAENNKLWEIINSAVTPLDPEKGVTLDDLNYRFSIDGIKLNAVLDEANNAKLFDVLRDVLGKGAEEDIKISDLNGTTFDMGKVHLNSVLEGPKAGEPNYAEKVDNYNKLVEIIEQAVLGDNPDNKSFEDIIVSDLTTGFKVDGIKLNAVLDETNNAKLFDVLRDVLGKDAEEDISIGDLNGTSFDMGKVHLNAVLEGPKAGDPDFDAKAENYNKLVEIIEQAIGAEYDDVTVADLSMGFELDNVKLDTVISAETAGDNKILGAILGKNYTVGEIGEALNGLAITEVFEIECFTETADNAADPSIKYKKVNDVYTLAADGTYYISKNAKIWLFLLYDAGATNADGVATTYTDNGLNFNNLDGEMGNMSNVMLNASIRQLYLAGILPTENDYSSIYSQTMLNVIDAMALLA